MCLPVHAMVESHFSDRPMIVSGIGNGVLVPGRVYDDDAPLAMVRHFGHGGGRLIAFVSVITYLVVISTC